MFVFSIDWIVSPAFIIRLPSFIKVQLELQFSLSLSSIALLPFPLSLSNYTLQSPLLQVGISQPSGLLGLILDGALSDPKAYISSQVFMKVSISFSSLVM